MQHVTKHCFLCNGEIPTAAVSAGFVAPAGAFLSCFPMRALWSVITGAVVPFLALNRPMSLCWLHHVQPRSATFAQNRSSLRRCARTNAGRSTQRRPHIRLCSRSLAWKLGGVGERAREGEPPSAHTADQSQRKLKFDDRRQQFSSISVEVRIERKLSRASNTWGSNWKNFTRGVTTPKSRKKSTRFRCRKQHRRPTDLHCYIRQV